MTKYIMGCDIGYGDVKVTIAHSDGEIFKQYKFPSIIAVTKVNPHLQDDDIVEYKGHYYYVAESALVSPSDSMINITEYKNLEYYAPLFLFHAIKESGITPSTIVTGLSKAQIENSGFFKANLQKFVINNNEYHFENIFVLPQGAGSKMCIDRYGNDFPNKIQEFTEDKTYVGCDIGFNTLDMFMVTKGKTSSNLFEGIEGEGILKIAKQVVEKVKTDYERTISFQEAKEIIDTGSYKTRGVKHDMKEYISELKKSYLKNLLTLIENRYGKILDKCDFISLSGGGSTIFTNIKDGFIHVPKNKHEYYNSIGFMLYGLDK